MTSSKPLPQDITTKELMMIDYRHQFTEAELRKDWASLVNCKVYKTGSQFKPGMKLCQHFFPNFWGIEDSRGMSFEKAWKDEKIMDKVRQWGLAGMSQLWLSWIRRAVYMCAGLPNSSFYRPHFARQIINKSGFDKGVLFDPCAGWGGRLLGTVSTGWRYIGCEPNKETYDNLLTLVDFIGARDQVVLYNLPAEELSLSSLDQFDIVLTSPPYYNLEIYSKDEHQSYNFFKTYEEWSEYWLKELINRCLEQLKPNGISAWNVMNMGKIDLVSDVFRYHQLGNFEHFDSVGFNSPLSNIRQIKNKDVTYLFRGRVM